ncbi:MAG: acetyl-CoA carboxylase biotin carboxylase subunit [Deltaproteobacteria bacterium]|nr:acetyl-CoA carboxylase biotin carboxylase subunit [Deltaproteobacteria bacterium]
MFRKVLIANRGEIAVRILRACKELGLRTVAVHSTVDEGALHVRLADEAVCIGPGDPKRSYLHIPALISAAEVTGADAIHPGYGFLSENAEFAEVCRRCRITFIGPSPEAMRAWGDKVSARENARALGLPMLPGTGVLRDGDHALAEARAIGFPVILKASGGGGGRGMKIVREPSEVPRAYDTASAEALAGFRNPDVYLERYLERPRHIEFQLLADQHGNAVCVGERECSIQRRHQKVLEEAPAPSLPASERERMGALVAHAAQATGYTSLGTLEFLMDPQGRLYFMEMNTRVQVEHPVTELTAGVDLVAEQILVAGGAKMGLAGRNLAPRGHAIECRVNAEDPVTFAPSPGKITGYLAPGGPGVRVDSAAFPGALVPPHYDSLVAKVIVRASTRTAAIARMRRALDEMVVEGIKTTLPLLRRILDHPAFQQGEVSTSFLQELLEGDRPPDRRG